MSASTFRCPNCNEFIFAGSETCRHCSAPVNIQVADQAIYHQGEINRACNSASQLRNLAVGLWLVFFFRLIALGFLGSLALLAGLVAVPIWALIWAVRYFNMPTPDLYFKRAKRDFFIAVGLWLLLGITLLVLWVGTIILLLRR